MASARLTAVIDADTTPLTAGLNRAMAGLRSFLTLGALAAAARQAIAYGSAINDAALKSGVGVKWLQATAYAAKLAGSSLEELTTALVELRRAQAQALGGSTSDVSAFAQLGISLNDLRGASPEALFDRVASAVQKTGGGMQEVNAALQVLGRGGKGLLAGLVDGFSDARAEAYRLGLVLETSTIAALDKMGDRLDTVGLKLKVITAQFLEFAAHAMTYGPAIARVLAATPFESAVAIARHGPAVAVPALVAERAVAGNEDATALVARILKDLQSAQGKKGDAGGVATAFKWPMPKAPDELQRVGGFMSGQGMAGSSLIGVQNQALSELRKMRQYLDRLANRRPGEIISW